jgi:hypothetical protein
VKLVELADESVRLLKESGSEGIRSDILAEQLCVPKRRVYDVVAVLRALGHVKTKRRFDGTTITWIDQSAEYVPVSDYDQTKAEFLEESNARKQLQVELAEIKEQLRMTKSKLRRDVQTLESSMKTEFNTSQLRIRCLSSRGFKRVSDSGMEAIIETYEPGVIVDPTELEEDRNEALLKNLQRI